MDRIARSFFVVTLGLSMVGCNLLDSGPKKACAKATELFAEPGKDTAKLKESCVADLTRMKKDDPQQYECTTNCITGGSGKDATALCMAGCKGQPVAKKGADDDAKDEKDYPIDSATPSALKSTISSEYQHFGYDITGEKNNEAGWAATVAIGKKGASGEVHIYKVVLVDVKGRKDGFQVVEGLKKGHPLVETRVGNKKALYVECLYNRAANEGGTPKACKGYDSRIRSFTNELEKSS